MTDTETPDFTGEPRPSDARQTPKPSYGGAGRIEGAEARIASIEAHVDHMRDDLGDMRRDLRELTKTIMSANTDVRELDDRVSWLPGKGWMFVSMLIFTAIICAVMIYLDQVRQYLHTILPWTAVQ
jgi:hypothetical protein